jgi:ribonuclease BN (tRNA processing enzyme)
MSYSTKFITLGTAGGPVPKAGRAQPAHAIVHQGGTILVDCGEGAFAQLMKAGIDLRDVHEIFISHHHFDHIGSLFAGLGLNMMLHRKQRLNIYGPAGTQQIIGHLIEACDISHRAGFGVPGQTLPHPRDFVQVRDITPADLIEVGEIQIKCCENTHYRSEDQATHDGPVSLSLRFDAPDRSMVFTGDTGPCQALERFAQGAQLLVGELIDVEKVMQRVRLKNTQMPADRIAMIEKHLSEHHLNADQLGRLAASAGVDHLVAVHIPINEMTPEMAPQYVEKIAENFSGKITISEDLAVY